MNEPITVTALNQYIKTLFDRDRALARLAVRGELSNYKIYPSGHHYFTLKDAESSIRCVLFRREASMLRFRPENGMKVVLDGRVSVYPRDGAYQFYCSRIIPDGVGELAIAFEQLKNRLYREGLFDPAHKKPLPAYPQRIALVTSAAGAAVRDMIRILGERYPLAQVLVVPVKVQGEGAAQEIAAGIRYVNARAAADLIITGRGGGSAEDLWAFNEEIVARAIYDSVIPVISAVGHEPDVAISDFVADVRASTPSNAAELAVPDRNDLRQHLAHMSTRMNGALNRKLEQRRYRLKLVSSSGWFRDPYRKIGEERKRLDGCMRDLNRAMAEGLRERQTRLGRTAATLDAVSPLKILARGYAVAQKDDKVLVSVTQAEAGDRIRVRLSDGALACEVIEGERYGGEKTDI